MTMSTTDAPTSTRPDRHGGRTHHVELVMGTAVSFDLRDGAADGLAEAVAWLHHVDATFSPYRDDSPITRLGRGELDLYDVDDEVRGVLLLCERLAEETGGAFDAFAVPAPNGTMLDPSGVVKGWSIEHAAGILERHGHTDFTVNAGGDVAIRGQASPGVPWRIGIRHPAVADRFAAVLDLTGPMAVATSATYERGAHIVDPRTGQRTIDLASVTIVGRDLTLVDADATAVFVMGLEGLDWLLDHRPGHDAFVVTHDDRAYTTPGFDRRRADRST
jgi:thiamine biosynthesis lipoprotein